MRTPPATAPRAGYPAVYRATVDASDHRATLHRLFFDESTATMANVGSAEGNTVHLA
jgi:hypothetical protein